MRSILLAASVLGCACSSAIAEVKIDAAWTAEVYSISDPSSPPTELSGDVGFFEPGIPFDGAYTFRYEGYTVELYADFAHGSGVEGTVNLFGPNGDGPGFWTGGATLVDEPATAALMLASIGFVSYGARLRRL